MDLDYYASGAFNTFEYQALPTMHSPPLNIRLYDGAKPVASHTPIGVPLHWQKAVKAQLDRDVKLGVIEKVPSDTDTTWCHRMIIVPKKDQTPRRTINFQPLNNVAQRQTHHTIPPFEQVSMVPPDTYKCVLDAWNGYHSVALATDSKDLTTFITPWGRYRYVTMPQGFLASGDAYTERFDPIVKDVERMG